MSTVPIDWDVFVVREGRAHRTLVQVGHRTAQLAEVPSGVAQSTTVVLYRGDALADGVRVAPRVGG